MNIFYTAKSFSGETKSGEMKVNDERELAAQLRADGFVLTSFKELKNEDGQAIQIKFMDRFSGISVAEKMMFAKNLSVMISSGLPLSRALQNITKQTVNKKFIDVLTHVGEDIQTGASFADSLAKFPGTFDDLFINMIRVGEVSGSLEEVLNILALQLEKDHELIKKVRGALVYPSVILVAMGLVGIVMMVYVVPQITGVFKDLNATLPASTQFIIDMSSLIRDYWYILIFIFPLVGIGLKFLLSTDVGKKLFGVILLNIPVIKNIVIKVNCARFARIYSSLLKSGVSVVEALRIISRTLTNFYYKRAFTRSIGEVQKGVNLSKIIGEEKKIFPVLVSQMIEVGEETGKTEAVLGKLAEFYEDEVDQITKNLSSIIEPVLMLLIGTVVGFFAVSILQPMYSVLENIK
ncbi:MAG: pilin biogenesis protein [Candidatus Moranbacteria bacterium GW2011_GWA2_39_41]|nr:MAG: pilin biogenesis protein [Candidatus Moranbacteria bacterium GW2011_GWA2_39_41]